MKRIVYIFNCAVLMLLTQPLSAQCTNTCGTNLIANGGFENATGTCSNSDIQIYANQSPVQGWFGTQNFSTSPAAGSTPDYFSPCAGSTNTANNSCLTGNSRVGVFTHTSYPEGREYVQSQLNSPLIAGKTYCFSMVVKSRVGAAGNILSSCDGMGAWFHNQGLINISTMNGGSQYLGAGSLINAIPQVDNQAGNLIGSTCVTITGSFCANGGENWVVLGNFRDDANTQIIGSNPSNYIYIDDVSLFEICSTPFDATIISSQPTICPGDCSSLSASASGGSGTYSFLWMPGGELTNAITVCPNVTTTYTLTTTTQTPCGTTQTIIDSITVGVNNCFSGVIANGTNLCEGQCTNINASPIGASGNISYVWQPGNVSGNSINVCPLLTTVYTVTATNLSGLSFTDTCVVNVFSFPNANAGQDLTICNGGTATLNGSGLGSLSWNTNPIQTGATINVSPSVSSDYILTATNGNCVDKDTVNVAVAEPPVIEIQKDNITCFGLNNGTATATISGGLQPLSFHWSPGNISANSISNLTVGQYTFTVTDNVGCTYDNEISITQPNPLSINIDGPTIICSGTSAVLSAEVTGGNLGYTYDWHGAAGNTPVISVSPTMSTNYSLTVIDPEGCQSLASHLINVQAPPQAIFSGTDTMCVPFNETFSNQSIDAIAYNWFFGDGSTSQFENPTHSYTSPGNYTVLLVALSANGCTDTMKINNAIVAVAPPVNSIRTDNGEISELDPVAYFDFESSNAVSCEINFGDGIIANICEGHDYMHVYKDTGSYCATIVSTNAQGCKYTSVSCVYVNPEFSFYIPNSFTPNSDGSNETFTGYGANFKDFELSIFNRWGELIYQSSEYDKPWDGRIQGDAEPCQVGVYIYLIKVSDMKGVKKVFNGQVNLIR